VGWMLLVDRAMLSASVGYVVMIALSVAPSLV
jgi:hypothetical protein